jgi:hypothetical protein
MSTNDYGLKKAFTNPFGEVEVLDLNDLPTVNVLWQERVQSWPIPQIDPSIELSQMLLLIDGERFLWKRAWWNRGKDGRGGMKLSDSITRIPEALVQTLTVKSQPVAISADDDRELRHHFVGGRLRSLTKKVAVSNLAWKREIQGDIEELAACIDVGAYRASLALVGRCLEATLKAGLEIRGIAFGADWMVGRLLTTYDDQMIYLDPTLKNQMNILNIHRIAGVHFKERAEVPSCDQAVAAVLVLIDTVTRCLKLDGQEPGR